MNEGTRNEFIAHRAEALAAVFLTRRPDVEVTDFGSGIHKFVRIIPTENDDPVGFFGFGVKLSGTGISLPDQAAANRYGKQLMSSRVSGREKEYAQYYFPVIALLFTMEEDRGYCAWFIEPIVAPGQCHPHLRRATKLEFSPLRRDTLDEIVQRVKQWYKKLAQEIFDQ